MLKFKSKKPMDEGMDMDAADAKPSLATAMAVRRNVKKMAYGGAADRATNAVPPEPRKPDNMRPPEAEYMANRFAQGGEVDDHYDGIASAIMRKKRMAAGGMVDINENAEESGQSPYDDMNSEAAMKELYEDDQLGPQPESSNEHGDADDDYSVSSQVRKRMKSR